MATELATNNQMIPNLIWYQNKESVIVDINKVNPDNYTLNIGESNFSYKTTLDNIDYQINFELFSDYERYESKIYNNQCRLIIHKKEETSFWTRLTSKKNLYKNYIKINWNNWVDEDEDDEDDMDNNFDMESMMRAMGGGGMPGMGMPGMDMGDMDMPNMDDEEEEDCCDEEGDCCDDEKDNCCETEECCNSEN